MIRFTSLLVLAAVIQVIAPQNFFRGPPRGLNGGPPGGPPGSPPVPPGFEDLPEKCRRPPEGVENPEQCCIVEPMYTPDELAGCGFQKAGEGERPEGPPDCSKPICLLDLKSLLDPSKNLIIPEVEKYMDGWATDEFKPAVARAKEICLKDGTVPGPPQICEPARLMHCVGAVVFANCPESHWQQNENCQRLKDHMEECKPPQL